MTRSAVFGRFSSVLMVSPYSGWAPLSIHDKRTRQSAGTNLGAVVSRSSASARQYHSAVPNMFDLMLRLLVALVLGAIVGLERERQERAAGLRTVTMVSLGSCLFTIVGAYGFSQTDPSRVAAQIVTGIGFLGAGTIFLRKDLVRGLTTAARSTSAYHTSGPPPISCGNSAPSKARARS